MPYELCIAQYESRFPGTGQITSCWRSWSNYQNNPGRPGRKEHYLVARSFFCPAFPTCSRDSPLPHGALLNSSWGMSTCPAPSNVPTRLNIFILCHPWEAETTILYIIQLSLKYPLLLEFLGLTCRGVGEVHLWDVNGRRACLSKWQMPWQRMAWSYAKGQRGHLGSTQMCSLLVKLRLLRLLVKNL